MKRTTILLALLAILAAALPAQARPPANQLVTPDEARTVATNWIALTIYHEGEWGDSEIARLAEVREFKRGDRLLGYFCRVEPHGFILVPTIKNLGPAKAFSGTTDLNPDSEVGLADLLKDRLERILDTVEPLLDSGDPVKARLLSETLEMDARPLWPPLLAEPDSFREGLETGVIVMDYQGGDPPLLTSHWSQGPPYNNDSPAPPSGDDCSDARCAAGCGAVAAAQVLRYWGWPHYYGWPEYRDMPNRVDTGTPTQRQIDAVAEFLYLVGASIGQDWCGGNGCETSSCFAECPGNDILNAFEGTFGFSTAADDDWRYNDSASEWFDKIKSELNHNRPFPYHVEGHHIVCDGWKVEGGTKYYHMNYGWGWNWDCQNGCDAWYELDHLHLRGDEIMLRNLYPAPSLGQTVSGWYSPPSSSSYRYFNRDCSGNEAHFDAGHSLQFLPGVKVVCTGTLIEFRGWSTGNTRLFSHGDPTTGIRIRSGHIYLFNGGGIRLY